MHVIRIMNPECFTWTQTSPLRIKEVAKSMQGRPVKADGLFSGRCTLEGTQVSYSFNWNMAYWHSVLQVDSDNLMFHGWCRLREQFYTLAHDLQFWGFASGILFKPYHTLCLVKYSHDGYLYFVSLAADTLWQSRTSLLRDADPLSRSSIIIWLMKSNSCVYRLRGTIAGAFNRLDVLSLVTCGVDDNDISNGTEDIIFEGWQENETHDPDIPAVSHRRGMQPFVFVPFEEVTLFVAGFSFWMKQIQTKSAD